MRWRGGIFLCLGLAILLIQIGRSAATSVVPLAPEPTSFTVQFEPESTELTSFAQRVLAQALADYYAYAPPVVYVDGYYDPSAGENHAIEMSQKLAETVRDYLVAHGIPANSIELAWHGGESPLLPSAGLEGDFRFSVDVRFSAQSNPYRQ